MLVYRDTKATTRKTPPPWLDGAADLLEVADRQGKYRWWGIGNAHLIGERDDWRTLDDGWEVAAAGKPDPRQFRRVMRWCRTVQVKDTRGMEWTAPVITDSRGNRLILVSYGPDYLPALNPAQQRAWEIVQAAREHFAAVQSVDEAEMDMPLCAHWAAELLALTHHISMEVIGVLRLLDDALILEVLSAAVGGTIREAATHD
jgi:hypothetical protein